MPNWICTTCCVEYPDSPMPPAHCPICEDERQYVGANGQQWTTMAEIGKAHANDWREQEKGLAGIGVSPAIGIGQRALLVQTEHGNVLWDCVPLLDAETKKRIAALGGLAGISASHPHMYAAMVSWSEAFGNAPIFLHKDDAEHVMRPSPNIRFWDGESQEIVPGVTLYRCGGHFAGSTVLHWPAGAGGRGVLLTGDTIQVVPDTRWVSFMRSYPNLIPLPAGKVRHIVDVVRPLAFEELYAAWWDRVVRTDANAAVERSAERYIRAITD
jgi:hypothetical protein